MNLSDIIREVGELAATSKAVRQDIRAWVNRGQRALAQRHSFSFMHSIQGVTIATGTMSAALPANFKELSNEQSPITYTAPTSQFPVPVRIMTRAQLESSLPGWDSRITNASGYWSPFQVFIEQGDGGVWTINLPAGYTQAENATYAVSCYLYPDDLRLGTDHTGATDDAELAEALVNWTVAKALLAEDALDQRGAAARTTSEYHLTRAIAQDARRKLAGRAVRM